MRAAFGLGSNLGDRLGHLRAAVEGLAAGGIEEVRTSAVYETDPVGGPAQPDYLNAVAVGETTLAPEELLALIRRLEHSARRVRTVRDAPRTLDVDLLALGDLVLVTDDLTVPHPRAGQRAFVLVPWAEVDADFDVPGLGPVGELAEAVDATGVRRRDDLEVGALNA